MRLNPNYKMYQKQWRKANPQKLREYEWKRNDIKLTHEEYERMFDGQGGLCAICERPSKTRALAPDHNHQTGEVRALLCSACNRAIGYLGDDPMRVLRAAQYLDNHVNEIKP